MHKVFVIFISNFLLASCVLPNRDAEFEATCLGFDFKKGTKEFASCVKMQEAIARDQILFWQEWFR